MIQIQINPARVEKVLFVSGSDMEEDFDFAAWQAIRPLVNKIDRRLRRIVTDFLVKQEQKTKRGTSNERQIQLTPTEHHSG